MGCGVGCALALLAQATPLPSPVTGPERVLAATPPCPLYSALVFMKSGYDENAVSRLFKKMGVRRNGGAEAAREEGRLHNYQGQPFGCHLAHRPFAS